MFSMESDDRYLLAVSLLRCGIFCSNHNYLMLLQGEETFSLARSLLLGVSASLFTALIKPCFLHSLTKCFNCIKYSLIKCCDPFDNSL